MLDIKMIRKGKYLVKRREKSTEYFEYEYEINQN